MNNQDHQELLDRHNRSLASNRASTQRLRQKQREEMGDDEYRKRERERMREYRARRDERLREAGLLPPKPEPKPEPKPKKEPKPKREPKTKRVIVSQVMKMLVWKRWVGNDKGTTKCFCCGVNDILMISFVAGHYISEHNGGDISVENIRPICTQCNSSMGTRNMDEFMTSIGRPSHLDMDMDALD